MALKRPRTIFRERPVTGNSLRCTTMPGCSSRAGLATCAISWAGILLAATLSGGCGRLSVDDGPAPPGALTAPMLQQWNAEKAAGGPTFSGSPAWRAHVEFVEAGLRAAGVADLQREVIAYERWWTRDDPAAGDWSLSIEGQRIPVASYWAYSGSTPAAGVTAPLILYDSQLPREALVGRIVVFQVPKLPDPVPAMFTPAGNEYATPDLARADGRLATDHFYQVNYATRFGALGEKLKNSGAAGGLVIFDMSPDRAAGIYTFPLLTPGELGVPGLYLDRIAGADVLTAARAGRPATLTLRVQRDPTTTWFLTGLLPGASYGTPADELVMLITHTDGPNLTQENGALGILAIVRTLAFAPRAQRRRSVLILLDPQHYMPGRHQVNWLERHPDMARRIVASLGVEHIGQKEYAEVGDTFVPTGRPEITILYSQDNELLISRARSAIETAGLPRTVLRVPARKGQGRWTGLNEVAVERNWPGYATLTEMSAYWSTRPGIESFDAELGVRQIAMMTELTRTLMSADLDEIAIPAKPRPE